MNLLTTQEAADFLRLKKNTLEVWRVQGRGPEFLKLGSRVLYDRAELERFAATNRRKSTSDPGETSRLPGSAG
jgi:excisionase family DNA binding protein